MRSTAHLVIAVHNRALDMPKFSKQKYLLVVDADSPVKLEWNLKFLTKTLLILFFCWGVLKNTNVLEVVVNNIEIDKSLNATFSLNGKKTALKIFSLY